MAIAYADEWAGESGVEKKTTKKTMENLNEFKEFYLKSVISNLKSYYVHYNEENFDLAINELIDKFYQTYQVNPFQISDPQEILNKLKERKEPFESYSESKGTNIPNAILNTHYVNFLKYQSEINFNSLQDFIDKLNKAFGNFCKTFQKVRIGFNGNSRVASNSEIFDASRDNYWTINIGSEQELQYHIFKENDKIGYGLGFNAQKSRNNLTPVNNVEKFITSFIQNKTEIERNLSDYSFYNSSINNLLNIKEGDFVLYGKTFPCTSKGNSFILKKIDFLNIYYDLRYKQFNAYKEIYGSAIKSPKSITQVIQINKMETLLQYKKQIILQGPPGTGKTREAKLIAKEILGLNSTDDLKDNEQFKLIQFHPSYTYEDFVRGIVAESKGDKIEYKNVNKTLGEFAELALKNYNDSKKNVNELSTEKWIDDEFTQFVDEISQTLEKEKIVLSDNVDLVDLMDDAFLYIGENWKGYEHRMSFKDIKRAYLDNNITRQDIVKNINLSGSARQHATYYIVVLKKFREFLSGKKAPTNQTKINEQKYILVIDEINRANLSSVLGELIYALEYRGEEVESMYEVDGSQKLILPPNLYIIGTMNTADRSVGHIDYAIRRRFAFVEVLPEKLEDNDEIFINTSDFIDVAKLFIKVGEDQVLDFEKAENSDFLSDDFSAKDVALGHSYFIAEKKKISEDNKQEYFNMKMKYEVIPILNEYLKDGVFNEKATVKIKEIEQRFA